MKFILSAFKIFWLQVKTGNPIEKILAYVVAGLFNFPLWILFQKYIFRDWETLCYLIILLFIDLITGFIKHFQMGSISSEGFGKFFIKLFIIGTGLIVTHVLVNFAVKAPDSAMIGYVQTLCNSTLVVYLLISIVENWGDITDGSFPPRWVKNKLKNFNETGGFNG